MRARPKAVAAAGGQDRAGIRLGLRANAPQFALLVAITAFIGAMVGLERSTLPLIGREDFGIGSSAAAISFIASFGAAKAVTNLVAGTLAARLGRRATLVAGWALAIPVPIVILAAPSWEWIVAANVLLGVNQGLTWSMTIVMKIDLVGPRRRGLALGLNEAGGYGGVAIGAALAGVAIGGFSERELLGVAGLVIAAAGLALSALSVRDTAGHVTLEQGAPAAPAPLGRAFLAGSFRDRRLRACSQAGFANNLNDGVAWGLVPLLLAGAGASVGETAVAAAVYPAVWGAAQPFAGWLSDVVGRRGPIVAGMLVQAAALAALAATGGDLAGAIAAAVALGAGTALVYPTLLAAVSDSIEPVSRAGAIGVYRFWRDAGYVAGGLGAGLLADATSIETAFVAAAALTALSGLWALAGLRNAGT